MSDSFDFLRKHNILVKKENSIFAEICKHYNMSYADINMLDAIYDRNKITEPTGYVKRKHNENDRRKVNVHLMPKGENLLLQVQKTIDFAENYIMENMGKEVLENMLVQYNKIIDLLEYVISKEVKND